MYSHTDRPEQSVDPDQTQCSVTSDMDQRCLLGPVCLNTLGTVLTVCIRIDRPEQTV